jgi:hypothetical protein
MLQFFFDPSRRLAVDVRRHSAGMQIQFLSLCVRLTVDFVGAMPSLAPASSREAINLNRERGHVVLRESMPPHFKCVRLRCLILVVFFQKILLYHVGQCVDCFLCVAAFGLQCQLRSLSRSQR